VRLFFGKVWYGFVRALKISGPLSSTTKILTILSGASIPDRDIIDPKNDHWLVFIDHLRTKMILFYFRSPLSGKKTGEFLVSSSKMTGELKFYEFFEMKTYLNFGPVRLK